MDSFSQHGSGKRLRVCSMTAKGRTTVPVAGEVDYLTSPRLGDELEAAVASGVQGVDVDLSEVSFCDCSGLNVLLHACEHARATGVSFGVSGPVAPVVVRLLEATGVEQVLPVRRVA
ncbi:STAS domain-containing protein [Streptomyces sp. CA-135486]|uniref:STAS domain-containing protein n=1 Tax=Streptomyces sp. CA-135486 TaxID=3240049 RepID=UPI003D8F21AE